MQDAHSSATPAATVADVVRVLHRWADPSLQADYDNSGLLVGEPDAPVTRVLVSLDCTEAVVAEAAEWGAQLVVSHHPVVFKPMKRLTGATPEQRTVLAAVRADVALHAIHTNLDHVADGVNRVLADSIGLDASTLRVLAPLQGQWVQLVVYVPEDAAERVEAALFAAGAGALGNYEACSFRSAGTGGFRPLEGANPAVGAVGAREEVREERVEVLVDRWKVPAVLAAMRHAHPYEEVAHAVVPLEQPHPGVGAGLIGELPEAESEEAFLARVAKQLGTPLLRHSAPTGRPVRRVAVCGGSGSFLLPDAVAAEADAFVTADVTYHRFFEPDGRLLLVDAGHYETEVQTCAAIVRRINEEFPNFAVRLARHAPNPVHYR